MKPRISDLICRTLFTLCIAGGALPVRGDVLAHGTADSYWVATIRSDEQGNVRSQVQYRPVNSAAPWRTIARINTPLMQLSHLGRNLVALRENGEWMIVREGSSSTGALPEDGSRLIHLAGDDQTLWAAAITGAGRRPTTTGATQPAATMPVNTKLLYRLERGEWRMLARLPNEAQDAAALSLGAQDGAILLAVLLDDGQVQTFAYDAPARRWEAFGQVQFPQNVSRIKLLPNLGRPALWGAGPGQAGALAWRDAEWAAPVQLVVDADVPGDAVEDLTVAGRNSIRMLVEADGKISEYSFDRSGGGQGRPVSVPVPSAPSEPERYEWLTAVAAAALLIVLMNTMRRREPATPEKLAAEGVHLAPFGRRFAAGLLDALPVLGTIAIIVTRMNDTTTEEYEAALEQWRYPFYFAMAVYVLHTLVCELLWGWSIGKRLLGMRVAMIDGGPPTPRAILLRNLLRVLDVMMAFAPLLIMVLSPLRQRVGDIVAETVVIMDEGSRTPGGTDKG